MSITNASQLKLWLYVTPNILLKDIAPTIMVASLLAVKQSL